MVTVDGKIIKDQGADILAKIQSIGCSVKTEKLPVDRVILWERIVTMTTTNKDSNNSDEDDNVTTDPINKMLLRWSSDKFIEMITGKRKFLEISIYFLLKIHIHLM